MSTTFGYISPASTSTRVNFIAADQSDQLLSVVGKMMYFDLTVENKIYRAIGTVTDITTENSMFSSAFNSVVAQGKYHQNVSKDLRTSSFIVQAVFVKLEGSTEWKQSGSTLPTSPSTSASVHLLDPETISELTAGEAFPSIGTFRGLDTPLPINTPDFGGGRGAYHSAVLGKSGSGKTAGYTFILSTYLRHQQHAVVIVDPQGQWANENGFIFSPQSFARALGRDVSVIRIAEEVSLPKDSELLRKMIDRLNAWTRFRRMGKENQEIFSQEVAERLVRENLNETPRDILTKVFSIIGNSASALRRIYASPERREPFRAELLNLAGEPVLDENGEILELTEEDKDDIEANWESLLKVFTPLLNLFSSKNLEGGHRNSLEGQSGVLSDIFQVRTETSKPAPYVIIDMSPDSKLHAKRNLNKNDVALQMASMLDNDGVKALILQTVFQAIKRASETAFASSGGNLNTQIVFDEAWRYAPQNSDIPEIAELSSMLEGFALDTRKFGIGWTYILQSPSDLNRGIWKQTTFVYTAYGLVGNDVKVLEERYNDNSQTDIYRSFIPPSSTGVYPMMIIGSISPLIFTDAPTFLNMFTDASSFLEANKGWINPIVSQRGLAAITANAVDPLKKKIDKKFVAPKDIEVKTYKVAKNYEVSSPQTQAPVKTAFEPEETDFDTPF